MTLTQGPEARGLVSDQNDSDDCNRQQKSDERVGVAREIKFKHGVRPFAKLDGPPHVKV